MFSYDFYDLYRVWVRNKEAGKVLMLFPLSFYTYLLCPLLMGTDIWQEIEVLNQEFVRLGISQSVDYEKYYLYSLITHSTAQRKFLVGKF